MTDQTIRINYDKNIDTTTNDINNDDYYNFLRFFF